MKNKSDKKRIFKNSIVVIAATIIEKLFFFVINILIARYLNIEHYGEYTTALEFATFFSVFTNLGINQTLIRAVNLERHFENEHFTNNLILKTILAFVVYVLIIISLTFTNYNSNTIFLTLIFGFVRIGNEYLFSFYALNDAKEQFKIQSIIIALFSSSFLASTVIIILLKGNYFHFAYTRAALIIIFLSMVFVHTLKKYKLVYNISTLKKFIKETIPFTLNIVYSNIIQRTNIIILSLIHGTVYSGIFNNGNIFFLSIQFIPLNLNRVLLPYLYKVPYKEDKKKFQFAFDIFSKYLSIISFFLTTILFLFADNIILILFGSKYNDSIIILKLFSLCFPFVFSVAGTIITAIDKQRVLTNILGIGAIANIVFNFILIYYYKAAGAAVSTAVTQFSIFVLSYLYLRRIKCVKIYNSIIIYLKLFAISCGLYVLNMYLLKNILFIYSFLIVSAVYAIFVFLWIINRDDIRIIKETLKIKN